MKQISYACATFFFLTMAACSPGATPPASDSCPEWDDNPNPATAPLEPPGTVNPAPPTRTVDLAACTAGLTQADIDSNLDIAATIETDFGEQRACGLLLRNYSFSLSHFFAAAACGKVVTPEGFAYNGNGYYLVGGTMGVQAKLAKDTSFGKKGDDIPFDLFSTSAYGDGPTIIKATIIADTTWTTNDPEDVNVRIKGMLTIQQDKPKPEGLELWGIPADGQPIQKQQEVLAKTIGESVAFTVAANVSSQNTGRDVSYQFSADEITVDATYNSQPMNYKLIDIVAKDMNTMQTSQLIHYGISFKPVPHGPLSGSLILKINGGKFPYYLRLSYPNRVEADVLLSCTEPTP